MQKAKPQTYRYRPPKIDAAVESKLQVERDYIEERIQSVLNSSIQDPRCFGQLWIFVKYKELEGYMVTNAHVVRNSSRVEISSMLNQWRNTSKQKW